MLTTSLVTVLGVAGAGGYLFMNPDKNFSEYVPEPITSLIGNYLPNQLKAEAVIEVSEIVEEQIQVETMPDEQQQHEEVVLMEAQELVEEDIQDNAQQNAQQEVMPQADESGETLTDQDFLIQDDDSSVKSAMDEIQKSINEESAPIKLTANDPKAKLIVKKIDDTESKITKLDAENEALEEKFQQILRKNRELAKQLQAIDKQLANIN